jgi:Ca2+-binding EF-hand superfamily protein
MIVDYVDQDKNGKITYAEFKEFVMKDEDAMMF